MDMLEQKINEHRAYPVEKNGLNLKITCIMNQGLPGIFLQCIMLIHYCAFDCLFFVP